MFCKWCGMKMPAGTTVCGNCGGEQDPMSSGNVFERIGENYVPEQTQYTGDTYGYTGREQQTYNNQQPRIEYVYSRCRCTSCGRDIDAGPVLCDDCANNMKARHIGRQRQAKKRVMTLGIVAAVLFVICIAGTFAMVSMKGKNGPKNTEVISNNDGIAETTDEAKSQNDNSVTEIATGSDAKHENDIRDISIPKTSPIAETEMEKAGYRYKYELKIEKIPADINDSAD